MSNLKDETAIIFARSWFLSMPFILFSTRDSASAIRNRLFSDQSVIDLQKVVAGEYLVKLSRNDLGVKSRLAEKQGSYYHIFLEGNEEDVFCVYTLCFGPQRPCGFEYSLY